MRGAAALAHGARTRRGRRLLRLGVRGGYAGATDTGGLNIGILSTGDRAPELLELGRRLKHDPTITDDRWTKPARFTAVDVAEAAEEAGGVNLWNPQREAELAELERDAGGNERRALEWLDFHSDHPWQAPFTAQRQVWVGLEGAELRPSDVEPVHGYRRHGYYAPFGGVWTTSEVPGYRPSRLDPHPNWRQHVWGLRVRDDARIYEVRGPEDWLALVRRHQRLVEREPFSTSGSDYRLPAPFYLPLWEAVADEWDGVRFTMGGLFRAINVPLAVLDGVTMLIDESCHERTLWFRWVFDSVDDLGSVPGRSVRDRQVLLYMGARDTWPRQLEAACRDGWRLAEHVADDDTLFSERGVERSAILERFDPRPRG